LLPLLLPRRLQRQRLLMQTHPRLVLLVQPEQAVGLGLVQAGLLRLLHCLEGLLSAFQQQQQQWMIVPALSVRCCLAQASSPGRLTAH
jgi:hypothetical protein